MKKRASHRHDHRKSQADTPDDEQAIARSAYPGTAISCVPIIVSRDRLAHKAAKSRKSTAR